MFFDIGDVGTSIYRVGDGNLVVSLTVEVNASTFEHVSVHGSLL